MVLLLWLCFTWAPLYYFTLALLHYGSTYQVRLLTATLLVKLALEVPTALLLAHGQNELCGFAETAMATGDTAALGAGLKVLSNCLLFTAHLLSTCSLLGAGRLKVLSTL